MYFTSPTSTISSVTSMSSSTASSLAMDIRPRSSSSYNSSSISAWPYRSCISAASSEEPNSYLSDEDLFTFSEDELVVASPVAELSTEEQIAKLCKAAEEQEVPKMWSFQQPQKKRVVRLQLEENEKKRRPSSLGKRRKSSKTVAFADKPES